MLGLDLADRNCLASHCGSSARHGASVQQISYLDYLMAITVLSMVAMMTDCLSCNCCRVGFGLEFQIRSDSFVICDLPHRNNNWCSPGSYVNSTLFVSIFYFFASTSCKVEDTKSIRIVRRVLGKLSFLGKIFLNFSSISVARGIQ